MIIKKYIAIGILNTEYVYDVYLKNNNYNNNYNNYNTINININHELIQNKSMMTTLYVDHKKFDTKKEVKNYIFNTLRYNTNDIIINWSIMKIYEDIYDLLEIRKYKIKKLLKKINKKS